MCCCWSVGCIVVGDGVLLCLWVWSLAGVAPQGVAFPREAVPVSILACPAG